MSGRGSPRACIPEVSALFLIRVFIEEYWLVLLTVTSLIMLSMYVLLLFPERLLDVLVFVVLWLQLELSYKQWWLELRRKKPVLRVADVETDETRGVLRFHVENVGLATAREICVVPVAVPKRAYEKYYSVLLLKGYMFKKVTFAGCGVEFGSSVKLPPHKAGFVEVESSELSKCADDDKTLFFLICYDSPVVALGIGVCTEAVHLKPFGELLTIYSANLDDEPPPGVLLKLPHVLRDARMYWNIYRADRRRRPRSKSRKRI